MFNFFSKNREQKIVAKIHNDIDTAQERLLQEAREVIAKNITVSSDKAQRLKVVGFTEAAPVKEYEAKNGIVVKNTERAELIEYYKQNYPFQKFITEDEMNRICEKYNLIYAPVSKYKGDVPEKNIKDIELMSILKKGDEASECKYCRLKYHSAGGVGMGAARAMALGLPKIIKDMHFRHWSDADIYLRAKYNLDNKYIIDEVDNVTEDRSGLFIAAPPKYFNKEGLTKTGKFGFLNVSITTIKDPIVFRYVRGGIQIITKWGLEASDELTVNEISN